MNLWRLVKQPHTLALLAAVVFAFTAQYLFTGEWFTHNIHTPVWVWNSDPEAWVWAPRHSLAVGLLLLALGCAAWAARREAPRQPDDSTAGQNGEALDKPRWYWLAGAGGCYALSLLIYLAFGENLLMQLAWAAGIGLLVIPLWRRAGSQTESPPIAMWEWALIALLTGIGFFLRYWRLTEIPSHVDNDVALMGTFGLDLIQNGNYNWVGFSASEHLLSYDQLIAWSMRLFGQNHYGVVMFSVLAGTATLPLVYLLGREMFNARIGLMAMALLTIDYTHIHFSRTLFGPTAIFLAVIVFYALTRGMRTQQRFWFALAGVGTGVGVLFYDSSRVVPLIALGVLGWQLVQQREAARANLVNGIFYGLGALIGFGPMLAFAILKSDLFVGRGNTVALWTPEVWEHSFNKYGAASAADVWLAQIQRTFLTFHYYADGSPHFTFPQPMVSALTAALLVLGLGYCFWRIRQTRYFIPVAWLMFTFVLGGVITYDPPYWPHLNIALPAVVLIAGLAADRLINALTPTPPEAAGIGRKLLLFVGLGALVFTGVNNWQVYYEYVKNNADPRIRVARYVSSLPEGYTVYFVNNDLDWGEYAFRFFDYGVPGVDATLESLQTPPPLDRPLLFILMHEQDLLPTLQGYYPTGTAAEHFDEYGDRDFVSLAVTPPGQESLLKPRPNINIWSLPGWWLTGGALVLLAARLGIAWSKPRKFDGNYSDQKLGHR